MILDKVDHFSFPALFAVAGLISALVALPAGQARAEGITIPSQNPHGPDLGKVAQQPTSVSLWRINPDTGDVSLVSGDAIRLTSGPSIPPTITIDCATASCRNGTVTATFVPTAAGRVTIVGFMPGMVTGRGMALRSVSGANTAHMVMTFQIGGDLPARATFPLGMTVRLGSGRESGAPNYSYTALFELH